MSKSSSMIPGNKGDRAVGKTLAPGEASELVIKLMGIKAISANADRRDPESLRACFYEYVQFCMQNDVQVTNLGAYQAMGISDTQMKNWSSGKTNSKDPRFKELADEVMGFCSAYREMVMSEGKINPILGIWWQKVYDKYTDVVRPDAEAPKLLGENVSSGEIAEKYKNIPE